MEVNFSLQIFFKKFKPLFEFFIFIINRTISLNLLKKVFINIAFDPVAIFMQGQFSQFMVMIVVQKQEDI